MVEMQAKNVDLADWGRDLRARVEAVLKKQGRVGLLKIHDHKSASEALFNYIEVFLILDKEDIQDAKDDLMFEQIGIGMQWCEQVDGILDWAVSSGAFTRDTDALHELHDLRDALRDAQSKIEKLLKAIHQGR